ncbi:hypothetical protein [Nonlabens sp.]|uniref:hypothetical protein n=2 Tax=Nonlabens sp. TaxID=1888209 RepID=UPI0039E49EB6
MLSIDIDEPVLKRLPMKFILIVIIPLSRKRNTQKNASSQLNEKKHSYNFEDGYLGSCVFFKGYLLSPL